MASFGMLHLVTLVRTNVSEERSASIIRVIRIDELGTQVFLRSVGRLLATANVVPSSPILVTLKTEAPRSSEKSVLTRATRRKIPKDASLHGKEMIRNLSSYHVCLYNSDFPLYTCSIFPIQ
jgi:hypothetical protein